MVIYLWLDFSLAFMVALLFPLDVLAFYVSCIVLLVCRTDCLFVECEGPSLSDFAVGGKQHPFGT